MLKKWHSARQQRNYTQLSGKRQIVAESANLFPAQCQNPHTHSRPPQTIPAKAGISQPFAANGGVI